jgi:hypothetical protein
MQSGVDCVARTPEKAESRRLSMQDPGAVRWQYWAQGWPAHAKAALRRFAVRTLATQNFRLASRTVDLIAF